MESKIPLKYKDRREDGETTLRQCQLVQLHLLHVFDRICKENGLQYLLEGGTLLGAMRHNGFIPWDDDLDVGMPRKDYEKFLKVAPAVLPDDTRLHLPSDTPHTAIQFAKLRDCHSFYCERRPDISMTDPSGIYVDIFPYDEMPDIGYASQKLLAKLCGCSWYRSKFFYNKTGVAFFSSVFYACLGLCCWASFLFWLGIVRLLNCIFTKSYCFLVLGRGITFRYAKKDLFPAKQHVFEDAKFPVPANADAILIAQYGDWRQIPPPEKRPRHARIIDPFHAA